MQIKNRKIFLAFPLLFFLTGLTGIQEIKDISDIKQDHHIYTERRAEQLSRLDAGLLKKADAFYNEMFFSPWHMDASRYTLEEVKFEFDKYATIPGYGRDGKGHRRSWIKDITVNGRLRDYPNGYYPAITVQNTDLRTLPTSEAHLSSPKNAALPFDNMQNSGAAAGTPILVSHTSGDGQWVLAETSYAMGWIPVAHIARVDAAFIKEWERGDYAAVIKDRTPVYGRDGRLLFKAMVGSIFPIKEKGPHGIGLMIAERDKKGGAIIGEARLSPEAAAPKPLKLTSGNMEKIANQLIGEPYGWGGLDEKRDCSSTLMDLFAPFGIWLPRNSGHQAKRVGSFISLKGLSPEKKEAQILKQGIPYFTLIWLKGHIMLYIGRRDNRALVFHNFWSVKTRDAKGKRGKLIVGRAAITTLRPGLELSRGSRVGDILPAVRGMTLIWPPPTSVMIPDKNDHERE